MNVLSNMVFGAIMSLSLATSTAFTSSTVTYDRPVVKVAPIIKCVDEACIKEKVTDYATKYKVPVSEMWRVIDCENPSLDPKMQSKYIYKKDRPSEGVKAGEQERSFGLVQIHLPAHPSISYEEATDVDFSLEFLAKNLSEGNGKIWTCY